MPFWLLHIAIYGWASNYRVSYFWNEVYETIFCFPALKRLSLIIRNPFAKASRATRKGVKADRKNYNFNHTLPLIILLALSGLIIGLHLVGVQLGVWLTLDESSGVLIFWLFYNVLFMGVAILSAIDQPIRRTMDRFPLKTTCKITAKDQVFLGYTQNLSESGARVVLITPDVALNTSIVEVTFVEYGFSIQAEIVRFFAKKDKFGIALQFVQVETEQQRKLVEVLYTEMTWWKQRKKPGNLDSFLAMIASTIQARSLLNWYD
jgi:cellulose synthase (UDP-forming)